MSPRPFAARLARASVVLSTLAGNTVREALAGRAWLAVATVGALLVAASVALGALTLDDPALAARHVGLAGIDLGGIGMAVALGVGLTARELGAGAAATVLTRPVTRGQLILGRWLGIQIVVGLAVIALAAAAWLAIVIEQGGAPPHRALDPTLGAEVWLYLVQALVVASLALVAATLVRPLPAGAFALALTLIGRGLPALRLIADRAGGAPGRALRLLSAVLPNLYLYNPPGPPTPGYVFAATAYGIGYAALAVVVAAGVVRRRDFV